MPLGRRPLYILAFLALLGVPQALAFVQQFRDGFRPFAAAPHRVPFSWDMFSVRIERCDVAWDPPLPLPTGPLARLHQQARPLEWDFTLDRVDDYRELGQWGCAAAGQRPLRVSLLCFVPEGKAVSSVLECR